MIRGGVTVGLAERSYRQHFGPAITHAVEMEKKAIYPRIAVDQSVLDELTANERAAFWNSHFDRRYAETLLQRDDKGVLFIDYLRIVADEFLEQQEYRAFLSGHARLIAERLERHKDNEGVRQKYEWLREYHRNTVTGVVWEDDLENRL